MIKLKRSQHIEAVLGEVSSRLREIETQTGFRVLIQWGEPLFQIDSPDLDDFDVILALKEETAPIAADLWSVRVKKTVSETVTKRVLHACSHLEKDLSQTSPEFALERFVGHLAKELGKNGG